MPLVDRRRRQTGSTSKLITMGQGGGGGRRPKTAAPQPRADNPEGDAELGGEVPQGWGICVGEKEEELPGKGWLSRGNKRGKKERSLLAAIAARGQEWGDVAGPTGQETSFNTRNAASGAAIARRVLKSRHCKGMLKDCGKKHRRADDVKGCTVTWGRYRRTHDVKGSGGDVRIDNCRANKGKNALWRNKDCLTDKEAMGREEAGGRPE
ncbi:hypothetical protein BY996DRAFT_6418546 [Phakopsora pachyrhizi]|nr:hypothetical protein BY996DRAFT_6418546 [Phakopsora pachyrhizi]